ncbi:MAG: SDR family oxidoreductase [Microscillaceae bacterium]|jgi:3-oxoacyl-[acyl-carrier protein] reductase|nr:SDR family oxidoreductase [Microscillaceae bacterium]
MNLDLTEKRALVCGSTQGIGKAAAIELALLGANVTLMARNEPRLQTVKELLDTSQGQQHDYIVADFTQPEEVKNQVLKYCQQNKINEWHILVNNTGGPAGGSAFEADVEEFKQAYSNHLIVNHLLVQTLVPLMKQAGYGRIINVISTSVKEPIMGLGVSNTTRWAVASWAKTLSVELGGFGITVNNLLPGYTRTARLDTIFTTNAQKSGKTIEQIEQEVLATVPAKRFGTSEEQGAAIAFLASPAAAYINGVNLVVDGGRTKSL